MPRVHTEKYTSQLAPYYFLFVKQYTRQTTDKCQEQTVILL